MLPQNLKYQPKVESAPARRYRTNIQPQTGSTFSNNQTIIINIPTRNNTALIASESVLKGTVSFTPSAAAPIAALESCGHHGWINRLRVFHGSNLLQDIQEYHQLAKILYDFQMPLDSAQGRYSITSGTTNEYTTAAADASGCIAVKPVNRGRNYSSGTPAGVSTAQTDVFSINLISLIGSLAGGKYLPLWEMTAAPLRVELVLQDNINKVMNFSAGAPTNGAYTLSNVEFIGEFLELPDSAVAAVKAGSSSPLQMVVPDYRAYTFSQSLPNATATTVSMPIPAKFSSLKSIFVNHRVSTGATGFYPSSSGLLGLTQYQFRIGSEVLPSNPPLTTADFFTEASKCFGSIADADYQPAVDKDAYEVGIPVALTTYAQGMATNSGSFLVGIDCESYQNADKTSIFAGMNTNTSDIFYIPQHLQSSGAAITANYTAFANYDSVLVCENGVAYTRF
jgi:hypothetical protein